MLFSEGIRNTIVGLLAHAIDHGHFDSVCSWSSFANPEQESSFTNIDKGIGQVSGRGNVVIVVIENRNNFDFVTVARADLGPLDRVGRVSAGKGN